MWHVSLTYNDSDVTEPFESNNSSIQVSFKPIKFCASMPVSFPLPNWEFDPPQPVSSGVTAKAISLSWLRQEEAWSGGRWQQRRKKKKPSDSGQTLLVWRPGAALRGPRPVTLKNDATVS